MAKVNNRGVVRGKVGPVIYRRYRDINIVQGKPKSFTQTQNSILASAEFGLSSSTAAVIRRAFEPAYIHRDGTAVSRSTQSVYRCIRKSATAAVGHRDLHDGDLNELIGMEFNTSSKLSEILQVNHTVKKLGDGSIYVTLSAFNSNISIKRPAELAKRGYKCRIRLMLIAFNFREEYLEYLDVQDISFYNHKDISEQTVQLKGSSDASCMQLLSMSLMLFDQMDSTGENVLLNGKTFSPCAIIAAFEAENPSPRSAEPADLSAESFKERVGRMASLGYAGNAILRDVERRVRKAKAGNRKSANDIDVAIATTLNRPDLELRKKLPFKMAK